MVSAAARESSALPIIAVAPADFAETQPPVERQRRRVAFLHLEMHMGDPGPRKPLQMGRQQRAGITPAAHLRRDRHGEDLGLVDDAARQHEAADGAGLPDQQPVGGDVPLRRAGARIPGCSTAARSRWRGWRRAAPRWPCRAPRCGWGAGGTGGRRGSWSALTDGRFGPRPAAWRRVRAGRAAWAGRSPDPRWRRGGRPTRCRVPGESSITCASTPCARASAASEAAAVPAISRGPEPSWRMASR